MKFRNRIREAAGSLFTFTPAQVRGIVFLLPLLAVAGVIIALTDRPRFEKSFLELADSADSATRPKTAIPDATPVQAAADSLFAFDPNTVTLQELCRLGFTARTAAGIIKYHQNGKRFEIPEDFATCYGVSLEDYTRLEPYIRIGEQYKAKPWSRPAVREEKSATALRPFDPNALDSEGFAALGFSGAQADVIIRYRHSIGGFRDMEDLARCYVVSDEMARRLAPYAVFAAGNQVAVEPVDAEDAAPVPDGPKLIEINTADSATLLSVRGIGEVLVVRIMEYRGRLGGFASAAQLAEIKGMSPENHALICEQIRVDSCEIQKIDVNFAPHQTLVEQMGQHPYVIDTMLRKLLKNRQLKGGWRTTGDMIEENIMTGQQAERLAPYLLFRSE